MTVDPVRDAAASTALLCAVADGTILLHWQPVMSADGERILYHEALSRVIDDDGALMPAGNLIAAAERVGTIGAIDRHNLNRVLDELEAAPAVCLGINISADSACLHPAWTRTLARLKAAPQIAQRLVVEITETGTLPSLPAAIAFANELRTLGCRIAIDDFGDGQASIRRLTALKPDIVKVDRHFTVGALHSKAEYTILERMIALAQALSPVVIVEGVETSAHREVVESAGGTWQQGYYWAKPSPDRPWRSEIRQLKDLAVRQYRKGEALVGHASISSAPRFTVLR
ncbi:EAL domain-containing protein [Novosphingobium guangzhouense]|uniref:EAL domain-containing protein n=1 Tax=Novosphingobium guangzhouense TaxID=1850347 RepID=UPI0014750BCC|nr:EAL domain-containing protein [Novosphingobium guangzhouense]